LREKRVMNERFRKILTFIVLMTGASIAIKLSSIKDAFYVPMMEIFEMNNAQFGATRSIYGIVQMIGYIPAMFIADKFSKKIMIPFSMFALAAVGFYFGTIPTYAGLLLVYALLAIFGEMTYWPIMLKSVRLLGNKDKQGRLFGFLEGGRGVVDILVSFFAILVFSYFGSQVTGLKSAIYFYSLALVAIGIVSYFLLDHDIIEKKDDKTIKHVLLGIKDELKSKELWMLAFTVHFIWITYAGLTSFIPFLKDIYALPVTLISVYGVLNQYALKLVGGPSAGILADKVFKSPLKTMKVAFIGAIVGLIILIVVPHSGSFYVGMILTLGMGSFIFMLRALAFSPMEELKIPKERAGSAMALVCLVGYSANIYAYVMYGKIIDKFSGMEGYNYVFIVMIAAISISLLLARQTQKIIARKSEKLPLKATEA
jgi:sugar phosphate permease